MNELVIATLATYGISIIVCEYDGPADIFYKLRTGYLSGVLSCATCFSVWVAIALSIALKLSPVECLAVIGANVLLTRNT
jgi:hypothetical protein